LERLDHYHADPGNIREVFRILTRLKGDSFVLRAVLSRWV
jgi:hypothetical protein